MAIGNRNQIRLCKDTLWQLAHEGLYLFSQQDEESVNYNLER